MPTSTKIHKNYSDAEADIVVVASGGTGFQVPSYVLKAASTVFRDMISAKSDNKVIQEIQITEDGDNALPLMDLVYGRVPLDLKESQLKELCTLSDKYDLTHGRNTLGAVAGHYVTEYPLEVFTLAAILNNVPMAERALLEFQDTFYGGNTPPWEFPYDFIKDTPPFYFKALVAAYTHANFEEFEVDTNEFHWRKVTTLRFNDN